MRTTKYTDDEERRRIKQEAADALGDLAEEPGDEYARLIGRDTAQDDDGPAPMDDEYEAQATPTTVYRQQGRDIADEEFGAGLARVAGNVPRATVPANPYGEATADAAPYGRATDMTFSDAEAYGTAPGDDMTFSDAEAYPDEGEAIVESARAAQAPLRDEPPDEYAALLRSGAAIDEARDGAEAANAAAQAAAEERAMDEAYAASDAEAQAPAASTGAPAAPMAGPEIEAMFAEYGQPGVRVPGSPQAPQPEMADNIVDPWSVPGQREPAAPVAPPPEDEYAAALASEPPGEPTIPEGYGPQPSRYASGEGPAKGDESARDEYARRNSRNRLGMGIGGLLSVLGRVDATPISEAYRARRGDIRTDYEQRTAGEQAAEQRGAQGRRDDERRALDERRVAVQEEGLGLRNRVEERQIEAADPRNQGRRLQNAQRALALSSEEERRSPSSEVSRSLQESLRAARGDMRPDMRDRLSDEALGGLTAEEIVDDPALMQAIRSFGTRTRPETRTGVPGATRAPGAGGGGAEQREQWIAARAADLTRRGVPEGEAREQAGISYDALDDVGRRSILTGGAAQEATRLRTTEARAEGQQERLARGLTDLQQVEVPLLEAERALGAVGPRGLRNVQVALSDVASGVSPSIILDENEEALFQAIGDLRNKDLRAISGAAVTENELERYRQVMGGNLFDNASMLRNWLAAQRRMVDGQRRIVTSGYNPRVVQAQGAAAAPADSRPRRRWSRKNPDGSTTTGTAPAGSTLPAGMRWVE